MVTSSEKQLIMKVVNAVIQGLTSDDFVDSVEVGGKVWDVYKFRSPR